MKHLSWIITLPLLAIGLVFSIANQDLVTIDLWPLEREVSLPMYLVVLGAVFLGFLAGVVASWLAGGRRRQRSRANAFKVTTMEREIEQLKRRQEASQSSSASKTPPPSGSPAVASLPAPSAGS